MGSDMKNSQGIKRIFGNPRAYGYDGMRWNAMERTCGKEGSLSEEYGFMERVMGIGRTAFLATSHQGILGGDLSNLSHTSSLARNS
ncbi:hypothetical protein KEJ19_03355, partial [Candidatus Bathyarchaeota archaeon]|nr:hypothetical protein [Candidatus Bathyarchaeota archaeon]